MIRSQYIFQTVEYMERLPEVQSAVGAALLKLGDGNWKMGEGVRVGMSAKTEENDETVVLEHFVRMSQQPENCLRQLISISRGCPCNCCREPQHSFTYLETSGLCRDLPS